MTNMENLYKDLVELLNNSQAEQRADLKDIYRKIDADGTLTRGELQSLRARVEKTNGRVTELERLQIINETNSKNVRFILLTFVVPVIVSLLIWGSTSLVRYFLPPTV